MEEKKIMNNLVTQKGQDKLFSELDEKGPENLSKTGAILAAIYSGSVRSNGRLLTEFLGFFCPHLLSYCRKMAYISK